MVERLDAATVRHVAELARLHLNEAQVQTFASQLSAILTYMEKLQSLNTESVSPTTHPLATTNVLRNDDPQSSLSCEEALQNAPQRQESFFLVPKVLDQDSG